MRGTKTTVLELDQLQAALRLRGLFGRWIARAAYRILELEEVNRIHSKFSKHFGPDFSAHVLEEIAVSYDIPEAQLDRIPKEGGFITVSNHHYGAVDGMILSSVIGSRRPDYKILTTFVLSMIPNLKDSFIGVDNFSSGGDKSISGIRCALRHLSSGNPLGLFPAGEVATWQKGRVVEDIPWAENIIKMVRKTGFPVIPIYFEGGNSRSFHILGRIHPRLRTIRLIHEMLHMRGRVVKARIGQPISASEVENLDVPTLGRYLRSRCYALEAQCLLPEVKVAKKPEAQLAAHVPEEKIRAEIDANEDKMLFETAGYRAYLFYASDAPCTMQELYRLREETFRAVGEGTGKSMDTDPYDAYYRQMILWHVQNREIVGAYRLGPGAEAIASHGGVQGLYSASLYHYGEKAVPLLEQSLELGRSFIVQKYQREIYPLRLLFTGLAVSSLKFPQLAFFSGPVSISDAIPRFYQSLIVRFLEKNFRLPDSDKTASPSVPFEPDFLSVNPDDLLGPVQGDISAFDKLLETISDGKYHLPVLVRIYFSSGSRFANFNVDPDFSNCLDALIFLRYSDFPQKMLRMFLRSLPESLQDAVWFHFYGTHIS